MDWKNATEKDENTVIPSTWLFLHYYEALNVLFRIENGLRTLVYVVLKNEMRDKWLDVAVSSDEASETTISALAKKRVAQHQTFGYLGYPISTPLMHLTSGELVRLITADSYWPSFKDFFPASKQVVTLKLQEIGDVRNALAHFRPLTRDDVEAVKQNAKQVLSPAEVALSSLFMCSQRVPTNTTDKWYEELRSLGTDLCSFAFNQSTDGRWLSITLHFTARIVTQRPDNPQIRVRYDVLNIDSPEVLNRYDELRSLTIYLTERISWPSMPEDYKPTFKKRLEFTFSRHTLETEYERIYENLKRLIADIDKEAELVAEDNLAKGKLIHLVRLSATNRTPRRGVLSPEQSQASALPPVSRWSIDTSALRCPTKSQHPAEYWGPISLPEENLISDSDEFPWMPTQISAGEPF